MNHDEVKFLLRARRPGGRDDGAPAFAEAMAAIERDPELKAWSKREERFDAAVARKLADLAPPAGLREAILAGARVSRQPRAVWRSPGWLAAAAVLALVAALAITLRWRSDPTGAGPDLAQAALRDLAEAHGRHDGNPSGLAAVQARLATTSSLRLAGTLDLEQLRRARCRAITIGGREVFEICFRRDGTWFHLYATHGRWGDGTLREVAAHRGGLVAATWSDAAHSYALVTAAGSEALRRVL